MVLCFLRKYTALNAANQKSFSEGLEEILNDGYLLGGKEMGQEPEKIMNVSQWCNNLLNATT